MTYPRRFRDEVFKLWHMGVQVEEISRQYNNRPRKETIWKWWGRYNWDAKKRLIQKKSNEKLTESLADMDRRHAMTERAIQHKGIKQMNEDEDESYKVTPRDINESIKTERLIRGATTEIVENQVKVYRWKDADNVK